MHIGLLREIKNHEYRVGLTPASIRILVNEGHRVFVEKDAGLGVRISDADYQKVGATILPSAKDIFAEAELIIKVKEPQLEECALINSQHTLFCYLHLAAIPHIAEKLLASQCVALAYETVTDINGSLPLLAPMSMIAGRLSTQVAAHYLEKAQGGRGILMGGVPGISPAKIVVVGGGVLGSQAAKIAVGMGAEVTVFDQSSKRLELLEERYGTQIRLRVSEPHALAEALLTADALIGAVLVPGSSTPKLISRSMMASMQQGSVIVDASIDQGGCCESSRGTTFDLPIFTEAGVIHYCVTNMPGGVPLTSTGALNHATLPFIRQLAKKGYQKACLDNEYLRNGLNLCQGQVTHEAVAVALGKPYVSQITALL